MLHRLTALMAVGTAMLLVCTVPAADTKKPLANLTDLSLEVAALQVIYQLELTPRQLEALAKLARNTGAVDERKPIKGSDKLRGLLIDLRTALRKHDDAKIDDLTDKIEDLKEKEKTDSDDTVKTTEAARKAAPEAFRLLTTRQTLEYLNLYDELSDPMVSVRDALRSGLKLKETEWQTLRDDTAAEVGWLVAGFDKDQERKVIAQTLALLDKAHAWKEKELAEQQPEVEKAVQAIMGTVGATDVLRHIAERDLAELLSNPQLSAALEGLKLTR